MFILNTVTIKIKSIHKYGSEIIQVKNGLSKCKCLKH